MAAALSFIARDGDALDQLIWREARLGPDDLPAVCAANPGICNRSVLSAGEKVLIPATLLAASATTAAAPRRTRLWD